MLYLKISWRIINLININIENIKYSGAISSYKITNYINGTSIPVLNSSESSRVYYLKGNMQLILEQE